MAIILDIDNCISDDEWRIHLIRPGNLTPFQKYDLYHKLSAFDSIKNKHLFENVPFDEIYIFTAMPEIYAETRLKWLTRNGVHFNTMFMRRENDHSPSVKLKEDMLFALLEDGIDKSTITAYDDKKEVIAMYRRNGVRARQVSIHKKETP